MSTLCASRTTAFGGVWLGDRLISGQPSQMAALGVAEALAGAAAARGEPAKILVGDLDGEPIEFWAAQQGQAAVEAS